MLKLIYFLKNLQMCLMYFFLLIFSIFKTEVNSFEIVNGIPLSLYLYNNASIFFCSGDKILE